MSNDLTDLDGGLKQPEDPSRNKQNSAPEKLKAENQIRKFQTDLRSLVLEHPETRKLRSVLLANSFSEGTWNAAISKNRAILPSEATVSSIVNLFAPGTTRSWLEYRARVDKGQEELPLALPSGPANSSSSELDAAPMRQPISEGVSTQELIQSPNDEESTLVQDANSPKPLPKSSDKLRPKWLTSNWLREKIRKLSPSPESGTQPLLKRPWLLSTLTALLAVLVGFTFLIATWPPSDKSDGIEIYLGIIRTANQQVPSDTANIVEPGRYGFAVIIQNTSRINLSGSITAIDLPDGIELTQADALDDARVNFYTAGDYLEEATGDLYDGDEFLEYSDFPPRTTIRVDFTLLVPDSPGLESLQAHFYSASGDVLVADSIELF